MFESSIHSEPGINLVFLFTVRFRFRKIELLEFFGVGCTILFSRYKRTNTEKEGFEPSRRFSRPTPFPGEPLRPAWVLLHGRTKMTPYPLRRRSACQNCLAILTSRGEDGIRTHVPVKANGFQDRLVMTTSIPLHSD